MRPARASSWRRPASSAFALTNPTVRIALALTAMALVWTLSATFFYVTPPWDNVEELFWAGSFELGYYKHPPLPSWIMGLLVRLAGRQPWLTYAAGLACGAGALFIVWRWSREMVPARRAALALLLGTLVAYHVQRATIYNHNTVQLLPIAGYWWMLWRVLRAPWSTGYRDWVYLGCFAALAFLTKYSAVIQFAVGFAFIVRQGLWRDRHVRIGLMLAGAVALLLLAPHLVWMIHHPELSVGYALFSVHSDAPGAYSWRGLRHVVTLQIARLSPMLIMAAWLWRVRRKEPPQAATPAGTAFDRRFLAWAAFGPVCAVVPASVLLQTDLHPSWLTTFYLPLALWAVVRLPGLDAENWPLRRWRTVVAITAALHVAAALGQCAVEGVWSKRFGHMTVANLPAQDVARALDAIWQDRVPGVPFKLLVGDTWFAGAVALKMAPGMQLLVDGEERDSPWLPPGTLAREGGMVLILDTPRFRSEGLLLEPLLAQANCSGTVQVPWVGPGEQHSARIRWGIVLPRDHAAGRCAPQPGSVPR